MAALFGAPSCRRSRRRAFDHPGRALGRQDTRNPGSAGLRNPSLGTRIGHPIGEGIGLRKASGSAAKQRSHPGQRNQTTRLTLTLTRSQIAGLGRSQGRLLCSVTGTYSTIAGANQNRRVPRGQTGASQRTGLGRHTPPMPNALPESESISPQAYAAGIGPAGPKLVRTCEWCILPRWRSSH